MLLRLITWPYVRKHVLRTVLTVGGIALGVAVFVGMNSANASVLLRVLADRRSIAGKTELQVTAGETGFAEDVLERVQSVAVGASGRAGDRSGSRARTSRGEGSLLILGVDLTGDRSLRDYDLESGDAAVIDDPLVFLAQPDSIMLSRRVRRQNRLAAGHRLTLGTAEGDEAIHRSRHHEGRAAWPARSAAIWPSWTSTRRRRCSAAVARSIGSIWRSSRDARSPSGTRELETPLGRDFRSRRHPGAASSSSR